MIRSDELIQKLKKSHGFFNVQTHFSQIKIIPSTRVFSENDKEFIEHTWSELLHQGKVKYSTTIIGVHSGEISCNKDMICISAYPVEYKFYKASLFHRFLEIWVTGPSGIVRLIDGSDTYYIFGIRKNSTAHLGGDLETVPGGFLEPGHLIFPEPFKTAILQELEEETGISLSSVTDVHLLDFGQLRCDPQTKTTLRHVVIDYVLTVKGHNPHSVEDLFFQHDVQREHSRLEFVPHVELLEYISQNFHRFTARTRFTLQQFLTCEYQKHDAHPALKDGV